VNIFSTNNAALAPRIPSPSPKELPRVPHLADFPCAGGQHRHSKYHGPDRRRPVFRVACHYTPARWRRLYHRSARARKCDFTRVGTRDNCFDSALPPRQALAAAHRRSLRYHPKRW
jgi:hypothetical protein